VFIKVKRLAGKIICDVSSGTLNSLITAAATNKLRRLFYVYVFHYCQLCVCASSEA